MNIVITLPIDLISHIVEGRKTIEVRKNFPKNFKLNEDWVYVCCAGQHKIMIAFKVKMLVTSNNPAWVWKHYGGQIRCPYQWWKEYTSKGNALKLWFIDNVRVLECQEQAYRFAGVSRNPQSFEYLPFELGELWFK